MLCMRPMIRYAKQTLGFLLVLSFVNAFYVLFRYNWTKEYSHKTIHIKASKFLKTGDTKLACVHPNLELWPENFTEYFKRPPPLECHKQQEDWVFVKDGKYRINKDAASRYGEPLCQATPIIRGPNDFTILSGNTIKPITDGMDIVSDFSEIKCIGKFGGSFSSIISGIMKNKTHHLQGTRNGPQNKGTSEPDLNVLMIGFDSVSRLTWERNLPKSHSYFLSEMEGLVMQGYNIVGDGTPSALLPILTGKNESELPEARRGHPGAKEVDDHPWIWKALHAKGYVTQWAEDSSHIGTFTYRMLGFKTQPVTHYMRTFYLAAEKIYQQNMPFCLGSKPRHLNMLEWPEQFYRAYVDKPKFSFIFHSELSHDSVSDLNLVDNDLVNVLKRMKGEGLMNNTILILMSDHGARFQFFRATLQGKYEERLPYFGISLPHWFKQKYAERYSNLLKNSQRLSTPYDIHETLKDILKITRHHKMFRMNDGKLQLKMGISLFDEIPDDRTCADAMVEPHWCACLNWRESKVSDIRVKSAALEVVHTINSMTQQQRKYCHLLKLQRIVSAVVYEPSNKVLQFKESADDRGQVPKFDTSVGVGEQLYQIVIETIPNNALYETTVKYQRKNNQLFVNTKDISRINRYGSQPICVQDSHPHLRPYCQCIHSP